MRFMKSCFFVILVLMICSIHSLPLKNYQNSYRSNFNISQVKFVLQKAALPENDTILEKFARNLSNFFADIYYNLPNFYRVNKISLLILTFCILSLIILLNSIINLSKRRKLEKDLKKEYDKIDSRIREGTNKLKLTEQHLKKDIEQLQDNEKYLKQIQQAIETMKLGVTISDIYGKIQYVNPAQAEMHGYDADELLGKNSTIFTSNVVREEVDFNKIKEWQGQIRKSSNIRKDKVIFPVQLISDLVRDANGKIIATITTCEDITKRSYDEKALKSSEENFRRIFDNIQDIYYEVDIDGIIKEISPSINTITNHTRDRLIGKPMNDLYANSRQRDNFLRALKKEEKLQDYEIMINGIDEENPVPCSVTAKLILDNAGLPLKIIGSIRDITVRKKAELQQQLVLKDLQQANKELRDFSYVTSHDLKSPLRAINTLANWLYLDYADKFDDKAKEQMNLLLGRVERMHHLIEAIFQFSSLGSHLGKKENIELNNLLENVIKKLSPPEGVFIRIDKNLPTINYEKDRIEQVFEHLISNAIQFLKKTDGKIEVGSVEEENEWQFYVKDNGPGIEKKYFEQIFEMFKTLQSRDELETSGIGLTIVKKIIEMNDGKVWLESKVDIGSTFFFTVPKKSKSKVNSRTK